MKNCFRVSIFALTVIGIEFFAKHMYLVEGVSGKMWLSVRRLREHNRNQSTQEINATESTRAISNCSGSQNSTLVDRKVNWDNNEYLESNSATEYVSKIRMKEHLLVISIFYVLYDS